MSAGPTTTVGQSNALPKGTRLGEFEIHRVIGAGGFGIVYMAFDHGLEREVAIKEYMPSSLASRTATLHVSLTSPSNEETFKLGLRSFVNEAKLLARFDHRSLIKVHRFWEERGTAYMVMPLLRGRTLREVRRMMEQPPTEPWLRGVLDPVLGALEVLHREDVYHRDIAPDNILIGDDGVPMLLDFGAARHVIQGRSQTLTAILKPSYAPIEQYGESANLRQGAWTDLYALGATLHYLITESPPAPATVRTVTDEIPPLAALPRPGISEEFLHIVDWMLAPRPLDRPQSVAELREVLAGRRAIPVRPTPAPSATAWQRTELYRPPAAANALAPTTAPPDTVSAPRPSPSPTASQVAHQDPLPMPVPQAAAATGRAAPALRYEPTMRIDPPRPQGTSRPAPAPALSEHLDFVASRPAPLQPPAPAARAAGAPAASRGVLPYAVGGGAVVLLGAALWWMLRPPPAPVAPAPAPLPAAASAVAAPASAALAVEAPASAVAAPAVVPVPAPAPSAAAGPAAIPAPGPAPVAAPAPPPVAATPVPATARTPAPAPAARASAPTPAPRPQAPAAVTPAPGPDNGALRPLQQQRTPAPAPAPARAEPTLPPPAPSPAATARTPQPAPAPAPAPAAQGGTHDPREACGRRMLIALHLCLVRECAKPIYHDHPECVQVRAIEERARNRNQ
jgi:serine/threonine protein kinase